MSSNEVRLIELIEEYLPFLDAGETLTLDSTLTDYGMDSLQAVSLAVAIEDSCDLEFPPERLLPDMFGTLRTLLNSVSAILSRGESTLDTD